MGEQPFRHVGLPFEPPVGETFEGLPNDWRGFGVDREDAPASALGSVDIARGRLESPVSILRACAHPVLGLLGVLLALVL
ncbi:MAG: hypothetical protein QM698_08680 [Micropepsaceae bacterium]